MVSHSQVLGGGHLWGGGIILPASGTFPLPSSAPCWLLWKCYSNIIIYQTYMPFPLSLRVTSSTCLFRLHYFADKPLTVCVSRLSLPVFSISGTGSIGGKWPMRLLWRPRTTLRNLSACWHIHEARLSAGIIWCLVWERPRVLPSPGHILSLFSVGVFVSGWSSLGLWDEVLDGKGRRKISCFWCIIHEAWILILTIASTKVRPMKYAKEDKLRSSETSGLSGVVPRRV